MKDNTEKDNTEKRDSLGAPQAAGDHVLGRLIPGDADSDLKQPPLTVQSEASQQPVPGLAGLHKKEKKGTTPHTTGAAASQPGTAPRVSEEEDDKLVLPKGALVAMRKSGGLRFTSVQVTVFNNGKVQVDSGITGATHAQPQRLRDKDLARLYRALGAADLASLGGTVGHQSPDRYAYEIAADLGQTTYNVTLFDGSIPAQVSPLIQLLAQIMSTKSG